MHQNIDSYNISQYAQLITECVELAKLRQEEKNLKIISEAALKKQITEITLKISAFEKVVSQSHERFIEFQDKSFSMIETLIAKNDDKSIELAMLIHQRISERFQDDPLHTISGIYNNVINSDYVKLSAK